MAGGKWQGQRERELLSSTRAAAARWGLTAKLASRACQEGHTMPKSEASRRAGKRVGTRQASGREGNLADGRGEARQAGWQAGK